MTEETLMASCLRLEAELAEAKFRAEHRTEETMRLGLLYSETARKLAATQADNERLRSLLSNIMDNYFIQGFKDACEAALSRPINLDALNEERALVLEEVAVKFEHGCEDSPSSTGAWIGRALREMAAAYRAKKEG